MHLKIALIKGFVFKLNNNRGMEFVLCLPQKLNVMNYKNVFRSGLLVLSMALVFSCSKDDDNGGASAETYDTEVAVTDAPIDNANVKGAFVTITNVKVNGKAIENFQTKTVDLLALQRGNVKSLGNVALESGATTSIVLELNNEVDVNGDSPGNYIKTTAEEKKALVVSSGEIVLSKMAEVKESSDNKIVLDFDLRKMIVLEGESNESFKFVSGTELSNSVRAVNNNNTGVIKGKVNDSENTAETIVVYAYEKGTYTEGEAEARSASGVRFENAVSSSVVSESDSSYELHFLEEGDYELHYAAYSKDASGKTTFQGMLDVDLSTSLTSSVTSLLGFNLTANASVSANVVVKGMKN